MATLARIRSSLKKGLSPKRKRELQILCEDKIMTTEQYNNYASSERKADDAFMEEKHLLRCTCGHNLKTTIIDAASADWFVSTKNRKIIESKCPNCSGPYLKQLYKDIKSHRRFN